MPSDRTTEREDHRCACGVPVWVDRSDQARTLRVQHGSVIRVFSDAELATYPARSTLECWADILHAEPA